MYEQIDSSYESHTLHKLSKLIIQILEFRAFKDFLFSFPHFFILIQRGRKKQLPPSEKGKRILHHFIELAYKWKEGVNVKT